MNVTTMSSYAMSTVATTIVALGTGGVLKNSGSQPDIVTNGDLEVFNPGVSPVTLSSDWPRVARLLLLASLAVVGSVGNVFMISAVMVEDHLRKRGNAFLVNVALADLLVTGLVIPASAILILAGQQESPGICRFEWILEALCFLVTVFTLATIAAENYARLCLSEERYAMLTPSRVTGLILTAWLVAGTTVALQSSLDLGLDFCNGRFNGVVLIQAVSAGVVIGVPALITIFTYLCLVIRVRRATRGSFKPAVAFAWDYDLTKTNMYSFAMFTIFWLPFGVTICVSSVRPVSARVIYYLAWVALSKSCFNNLLYCVTDRHFRNAYVKLFHYCCCKTTVSFSRRQRGDGTGRSSGDVRLRVHIIHSYASPATCRPAVARPNGRDVYEL